MGLSKGVYFSDATSYVGKAEDLFLLVVAQDPIPRSHHLSAPTKEPLPSYRQQDVQQCLAHLATKPQIPGTNALRCASVDSHCNNALHCCTYPICGTYAPPYRALTRQILSHGYVRFRAYSRRRPTYLQCRSNAHAA